MLQLLPYVRETYHSSRAPTALLDRLRTQVAPPTWFRWNPTSLPFEGEVHEAGFKVMRIIHYRNSFLPVILGEVRPEGPGTAVRVQMRLAHFISAFMVVWFSGVLLGMLAVIMALSAGQPAWGGLLAISGMLAFGVALVLLPFWYEVRQARPILRDLLER